MDFSDVVGQSNIVEILKNSIAENKVGHAYIFSGPQGIGKKTTALAFANVLLCGNLQKDKAACGDCISCRLLRNNSNPDFYLIESKNRSIPVDDIRNMQKDIVIKPLYSNRKLYLIADGEKMTIQAQNCLLKTLEEPPTYATIIITTSNYDALLDTICSRCTNYSFTRNTKQEVRRALELKLGKERDGLEFIIEYSDGVIGTALELALSEDFLPLREKAIETILDVNKGSRGEWFFDTCNFFMENKDSIDKILNIMLLVYRDLIVFLTERNTNILINLDKKNRIANAAGKHTVKKLISNIETIEFIRKSIRQNANYQLSVETMLISLQEGY